MTTTNEQHRRARTRESRVAVASADRMSLRHGAAIAAVSLAAALGLSALVSSAASAQDWQIQRVDEGTKPALGLTPDGAPVIVYMLERNDGWVRVARLEDGEWKSDQLAEGYFYGPPDLTVGDDGIVHAAYHDHGIEDAVYAVRAGGAWSLTAAADGGHDGWDNRITVDATGQPHMVGVDPSDFGGTNGVEYYGLTEDGTWVAEPVGSGPQTYRWAVSVAVDPDGTPWVAFHDGDALDLMLSHRTTDGWTVETIDAEGDTGLYNELRIGPDGSQHISYYQRLDPTSGIVRYAFREGPDADWQISDVDTLDNVFIGFTGARNITSIDLDSDLNPWIAYSDESVMRLARLVDGEWQIQTVTEAADVPLGQIVSLELDGDDRPHIAFADVTNKSELDGSVFYASLG